MSDSIGSLIISLEGKGLTAEERDIINHPIIGGVILFAHNYESKAQIQSLCAAIRAVRHKPCLIMVDQEGGRVQRFRDEFTPIPPMAHFGELYLEQPDVARQEAFRMGAVMASELISVGVDLSLAPVLDLNICNNLAIKDRAFSGDPVVVGQLALAFMGGMHHAGMAAVGKHFPGHGSVVADSHLETPLDTRPYEAVENLDLRPFVSAINEGIQGIMASHIVFNKVDKNPVGFSSLWLKKILRQSLGFKGIIISDDLNMQGAAGVASYPDRVASAREAGCDIILLCNQRQGVLESLDQLPHDLFQLEYAQWSALCAKKINETNTVG